MTDLQPNRDGRPDPAALARLRASRVQQWIAQARAALSAATPPERRGPQHEEPPSP